LEFRRRGYDSCEVAVKRDEQGVLQIGNALRRIAETRGGIAKVAKAAGIER
jgi:hypothetical protein